MELLDPCAGIGEEELAHRSRAGAVEVDGLPPVRGVPVGEVVRRELLEVVAVRPEMVVDDVQDDGQPMAMRLIHEPAQVVRLAVEAGGREEIDAVVAPAESPGELGDRHHLQAGHPEGRQLAELSRRRRPCALARERADVHLVDHLPVEGGAPPARVRPGELRGVDHAGGAGGALRLRARRGIGIQRVVIVETEAIQRADAGLGRDAREISIALGGERNGLSIPLVPQHHRHPLRPRRPDAKMHPAVDRALRADREPPPPHDRSRGRRSRSTASERPSRG